MITVYTDGGSRGNPGPSAFGFAVKQDGQLIKEAGGYIGIETNNFAEYTAVIEALTWLSSKFEKVDIKVYLDSQLVASQLSGLYKVKSAKIRDLVFKVRQLEPNFKEITYNFIPREKNKHADSLVNIALDSHLT